MGMKLYAGAKKAIEANVRAKCGALRRSAPRRDPGFRRAAFSKVHHTPMDGNQYCYVLCCIDIAARCVIIATTNWHVRNCAALCGSRSTRLRRRNLLGDRKAAAIKCGNPHIGAKCCRISAWIN